MKFLKIVIKSLNRMRLLSIFILLICVFAFFTLMTYRYINGNIEDKHMSSVATNGRSGAKEWTSLRMARIQSYCNPSPTITLIDELKGISTAIPDLRLTKVLVLIRHGDRGPLRPVRNMSAINCDPLVEWQPKDIEHQRLTQYLSDTKAKLRKSKQWLPYALTPSSELCQLGHLSRFGAVQHLTLGSLLGQLYGTQLNIKPFEYFKLKAFTTQYPRTFQSAVAFLYGFLEPKSVIDFKNFPQVSGTFGTFFCSSSQFCQQRCRKIEYLNKVLSKNKRQVLESHPAVLSLLNDLKLIIANTVNQSQLFQSPVAVFDGLMAYMCHNSHLPCNGSRCVTSEQVKQLIAYIEFHGKQLAISQVFQHINWLKIYGFLNELIRRVSDGSKQTFLLYSAHDLTIVALASALDFFDGNLPPYASRVIFETYKHNVNHNIYLRIIYNGKDVTRFTEICKLNLNDCLPFDTKDKTHLININILSDFIRNKFKSVTKTDDYQIACSL